MWLGFSFAAGIALFCLVGLIIIWALPRVLLGGLNGLAWIGKSAMGYIVLLLIAGLILSMVRLLTP